VPFAFFRLYNYFPPNSEVFSRNAFCGNDPQRHQNLNVSIPEQMKLDSPRRAEYLR